MALYLVRHAMPTVDPAVDPGAWRLSPEGRSRAAGLGAVLPKTPSQVASPEAKAVETVALAMGVETALVPTDRRLREVERPGEPFDDDVISRRQAWVAGRSDDRHAGWETPAQVAARVDAAIAEHHRSVTHLVVGTHGMAMTAWLVATGRVEPGDPAALWWGRLGFPDVLHLA